MGKPLDDLLRGIGNAVNDIRHKVVEEGWFGRVVTEGTTHVEIAPAEAGEPQERGAGRAGPPVATTVMPTPEPNSRDAGLEPGKD